MSEQQTGQELWVSVRAPLGARPAGALVLAVAACTFAAALAAGGLHTRYGAPPETRVVSGLFADLVIAGFGLAVVIALALAYVLRPQRRRKSDEPELVIERPPTPLRERLILALIALATLGAPIAAAVLLFQQTPTQGILLQSKPGGTRPGSPVTAAKAGAAGGVHVDWRLFAALGVVAAVGLLVLAVARRRTPHPAATATATTEMLAAVIDDLEGDRDPRRAVIKAYARMERLLGEHGLPREPFEAPVEYLGRALTQLRGGSRHARRITSLFERARFSHHEIDESMRQDAVAALRHLRSELSRKE